MNLPGKSVSGTFGRQCECAGVGVVPGALGLKKIPDAFFVPSISPFNSSSRT
jgi:hypothetical protein